MAVKIKEEIEKKIDAGFIVTAKYPQWLANIVHVPKKDEKVRMCVVAPRDFRPGTGAMVAEKITQINRVATNIIYSKERERKTLGKPTKGNLMVSQPRDG